MRNRVSKLSPTPGETRFLGEFLLPQEMAGEKPGF
ncbi:hypothetical protein SPLC1_S100830 [Arthrospira platensis C1]|nr:hypothetical protein SPLC1_S100830 [Arthrospira platensis C1]